jgi:hypothetical protein
MAGIPKTRPALQALLALLGAAVAAAASAAEGNSAPAAPVRLPPGRAILLRGTAAGKQVAGPETTERRFDASALVFPGRGPRGETRIFAVRTLVPSGPGGPSSAMFEEIEIAGKEGGGAAYDAIEDAAPELEADAISVRTHFPLEPVPPFAVPAPGAEARGEAEVVPIRLAPVRGSFVTAARTGAGALEVTRALAPGARPRFTFEERPAALAAWQERWTADPESGAPRRIEREAVIEVESEDGPPVRLETRLVLEAAATLDAAASAALERGLRNLDAGFRSIPAADEMAKRVEAFRDGLAGGPHLEAAASAAARRLEAFRDLFASDAGKKLASLLGKPAPDFTLEGLDGKKVGFRDAIRGKAALLTFWGVG